MSKIEEQTAAIARLTRELDEARRQVAALTEGLEDDTETEPRPPTCECQWEAGDSPCRVHGEDEVALEERDAALAELDAPETCDHCGDPCVDYRQRNGERWCIGCVSVDADARIAALEARLAEVVDAARPTWLNAAREKARAALRKAGIE